MDGESIWTSGMCPPCGRPSLIRASEISQLVNWDRLGGVYAVDMVRRGDQIRDAIRIINKEGNNFQFLSCFNWNLDSTEID